MKWSQLRAVALVVLAGSLRAYAAPPRKAVDLDPADPDAATSESAPPDEGETSPIQPGHLRPPPADAVPKPLMAPGQDYTVRKGDTLWDISGTYLANPWFWPKLWSYNPQISNPHWIYPGNDIRFYPGGGGAQVQLQGQPPPAEGDLDDQDVSVGGQYKIGYTPAKAYLAPTEGFITAAELAESGKVVNSWEEKTLLSSGDTVYMKLPGQAVQAGDRFVVFRMVREIRHPVTGELFGYLTEIRGTVRVTAEGPPMVKGTLERSFDTVERGDMVGPWGEKFLRNVLRKENERTMNGFIIASFIPKILNLGENHLVFIDRGRRDGVQEGNEFEILERKDGMDERLGQRWAPGLPTEVIGHLLVVDAKNTASAAVIVNSMREVEVGDHVEMIANQ